LQAVLITKLHETRDTKKPMAVGLEAVQRKYQSALDAFSQGRLSTEQLREAVVCWASTAQVPIPF
jgi:uncharacterized iron-regulated protein